MNEDKYNGHNAAQDAALKSPNQTCNALGVQSWE